LVGRFFVISSKSKTLRSGGDKNVIDKVRLLEELDETEKKSIFNIIGIAISRKRLKDNLANVLEGI